jgi:hypothetical protein
VGELKLSTCPVISTVHKITNSFFIPKGPKGMQRKLDRNAPHVVQYQIRVANTGLATTMSTVSPQLNSTVVTLNYYIPNK